MSAVRTPANDRRSVAPLIQISQAAGAFLASADEAKTDAEARAAIEGGIDEDHIAQQIVGGR